MSFFEDASLVLIPSAQKTSKVYSVKPTDGTGDLAFTRSNDTATRVASSGLIEKVRTNLILQSQTFDNASWTKDSATIAANTTTAPDGTTTADTLTISDSQYIYQSITLTAGVSYTISLYVRVSSGTNQFKFNTFGSSNTFISSTQTATTAWQRFSFTFTAVGSGSTAIYPLIVDGLAGGSFFIWGAQVETTDFGATPYIATTTAAVSVGPVANVPRLDYLNSSCPRLLLEPQRTNTITFSENVTSCLTSQVGTTVTENATASPDGYQSADLVAFTPSSYRLRNQTVAAATTYTMSVFFKNNTFSGTEFIAFNMSDGVIGGMQAQIQPANGTATFSGSAGAWTGVSGKVENYGNGWYRVSVTGTSVSGGSGWYEVASILPTKSAYFWGFSLELGAYATSYIPTLGAAVTRGADAASKTGISSLIGQTEGTLFVDFTLNGLADYGTPISVNDGATTNYIWLTIFASGILRAELYNGTAQASISYSGAVAGGRYKMAFGYKANDFALYVNGALVGTDLVGTTFSGTTLSRVDTNLTNAATYSTASESINQALLFKTRLTNAQLAELTA